ncbi:MAG: hypothetical protein LBK99_01480 [Opitutaceae bacterium]|jgi:hypothetical protein|nr:hypothetical protein [Opitutaceae bacterium]
MRFCIRLQACCLLISPGVGAASAEAARSAGIWIEGEDAVSTNFHSGKVVNVDRNGPSGGMFLRLLTTLGKPDHPRPPYFAKYKVNVPVAGHYQIWIASTPNNTKWASPLSWSVDGGPETSLNGKVWSGASWGKPADKWAGWVFGWTQAGAVELDAGEHELEIRVTEPREPGSEIYVACVDALLLTTSKSFLPVGNHPRYSTQPAWEERLKNSSESEFAESLNHRLYYEIIGTTREQVGEETSARVLAKISARPLPAADDRSPGVTEFGLHGMERPFITIKGNAHTPEVTRAYELLARTGVDSFRTADSCWHRLTPGDNRNDTARLNLDFGDLDFQVDSARKYGMTHLFTVGYPPAPMTVGNHFLSACAPRYHNLYKDYLAVMLERYKDKGLRWVEMGNEVDAPAVWWINSTPEQYVQEMRLVHEATRRHAPDARTVAFASTYARDEEHGGKNGGRRFVSRCFDLGIDKYSDAYSLHHHTALNARDFPAFFRRELERAGAPGSAKKPLLNTEQNGGTYPYDGVKAFARMFFLYDMPRMDYFIARDFYENGSLLAWGLFDMDWRPKLRMLAYSFSVDAMRGRQLVGIARPAPGVEAYVLKRVESARGRPATPGTDAPYSIVLWKTDRETRKLSADASIEPVTVNAGLKGASSAWRWDLEPVEFDKNAPSFSVGDEPIAIYTKELPDWKLLTRDEYLATVEAGVTSAPLPTDAR